MKILGFRADQVRSLGADNGYRLPLAQLTSWIATDRAGGRLPWAVVANGGATNNGAVDPLADIADICVRENLWFHVDAAYGWTAVLTDEGRTLFAGIERADSVTLDPHKWLAQTFEAGCALVRDGRRLTETFSMRPEYMQDVAPGEDEVNFADRGVALTRRFRALKIWLSIKVLGVSWYRRLVEHCFRLADLGQALLEQARCFEILSPRRLSIVCFRYVPAGLKARDDQDEQRLNELNLRLIDAVRATGRAFLSSTSLRGRVAIRFCFINWRTTTADVEEIVELVRTLGEQLSREP
jgi:glutamate/tyrosine decarboxylase-like PLP-dependent enzyme